MSRNECCHTDPVANDLPIRTSTINIHWTWTGRLDQRTDIDLWVKCILQAFLPTVPWLFPVFQYSIYYEVISTIQNYCSRKPTCTYNHYAVITFGNSQSWYLALLKPSNISNYTLTSIWPSGQHITSFSLTSRVYIGHDSIYIISVVVIN